MIVSERSRSNGKPATLSLNFCLAAHLGRDFLAAAGVLSDRLVYDPGWDIGNLRRCCSKRQVRRDKRIPNPLSKLKMKLSSRSTVRGNGQFTLITASGNHDCGTASVEVA